MEQHEATKIKVKNKGFYFVILFLAIFASTFFEYFFVDSMSKEPAFANNFAYMTNKLVIIQIFFAIFQSSISDLYCRKKMLVISILFTLVSLFLFKEAMNLGSTVLLNIAIWTLGTVGNVVPIAWAGIADISEKREMRFKLSLSILSIAVGAYLTLIIEPQYSFKALFYWNLLVLVSVLCTSFFFQDLRADKKNGKINPWKSFIHEMKGLKLILSKSFNRWAFLAFFFSEVAYYQIFFRVETLHNDPMLNNAVPYAVAGGYTVGSFIVKIIHTKGREVVSYGLIFLFLTILFTVVLSVLGALNIIIFAILFTLLNIGVAIFTPSLFALISPINEPHEQGKIFGLLDSAESFATILAYVLVFSLSQIAQTGVYIISGGVWLLGGLCVFALFKNHSDAKS